MYLFEETSTNRKILTLIKIDVVIVDQYKTSIPEILAIISLSRDKKPRHCYQKREKATQSVTIPPCIDEASRLQQGGRLSSIKRYVEAID